MKLAPEYLTYFQLTLSISVLLSRLLDNHDQDGLYAAAVNRDMQVLQLPEFSKVPVEAKGILDYELIGYTLRSNLHFLGPRTPDIESFTRVLSLCLQYDIIC